MILTDRSRAALLCSVAIAAISTSAAQAAPDAPLRVNANQEILGEVVVTATRQADTVNRVPLSVTAVTQASIDKAGVKNLEELSRTVPSVTLRKSSEGSPSIAIRGLSSTLGAPTTAVYLDDTPLQKRDIPGATTGNGTPLPALFDLERVEILRGPQGTLFGGSAEGGAIRFITPAPSLTKYSVYARTEASAMKGGDPSYEAGLAVGGPIIQDKLGFRASVWGREGGGYMDHVSIYDAHEVASNTNNTVSQAVRGALTWAASDRLRITPAYYWSQEHGEDSDVFWENVPAFTVNSGYFTNKGTVNGVAFNFADKLYQGGTFGHLLLILALGLAPTGTLMPFVYVQIAVAAAIGWLAFDHAPDGYAWIGITVLSASGAAAAWLNLRQVEARQLPDSIVLRDTTAD